MFAVIRPIIQTLPILFFLLQKTEQEKTKYYHRTLRLGLIVLQIIISISPHAIYAYNLNMCCMPDCVQMCSIVYSGQLEMVCESGSLSRLFKVIKISHCVVAAVSPQCFHHISFATWPTPLLHTAAIWLTGVFCYHLTMTLTLLIGFNYTS